MNYSIEFIFEYDNRDAQYYVLNYQIHGANKLQKAIILRNIKDLGLVSVTEYPNKNLARLLAKELDIPASLFTFTIKDCVN